MGVKPKYIGKTAWDGYYTAYPMEDPHLRGNGVKSSEFLYRMVAQDHAVFKIDGEIECMTLPYVMILATT